MDGVCYLVGLYLIPLKKKIHKQLKKSPPQLYKHLDNYLSGMSKSNKLIIYGQI